MSNILSNSVFFGVSISIIGYGIGLIISKKFKSAIFNPLLISIIFVMIVLVLFNVNYKDYESSAKYLSYLLTPATVCLAIPLYKQLTLLRQNIKAIIIGSVAGVLSSAIGILIFCILFNLSHKEYVTLLPKSITTAIGIGISEELGGIVTITVASIVITGLLGNIIAVNLLKIFKIEEPIAKGLAIGTSAHAMGTSKAMEIGQIEGAMSSLAIVVSGIMTVVVASIFANFL